jgi:serine/threonine-protein kinase
MLAGKALYRGETVTETIAHVITQPPDWSRLPASTPPAVRRLLRRCLEKDPRNRKQSAGDVRIEIDECLSAPEADALMPSEAGRAAPLWRRTLPWVIAAGLAVALVYVAWPRPMAQQPLVRLDVRLAGGEELIVDPDNDGSIAVLSPDGQTLVYAGQTGGARRLYRRPLDRLESEPIPGTEGASQQFFSPDGQSIGFATPGMLMRTQVTGGTPVPIAAAGAMRGATWGADDTIVYTGNMVSGLVRISASGGSVQTVTTLEPNERTHRWPWFLPDGKTVLFVCQMANGAYDDGTIEAVRVEGGARKVLVRGGTFPRYVEPGYLIYTRQGILYAARFDPNRLEVTGKAQPVLTGIMSTGPAIGAGTGNGASQISVASNGTAVHLPGLPQVLSQLRLAILDRTGNVTYEYPEQKLFRDPTFSPDGKRLAVRVDQSQSEHIHILDVSRGTLTRIFFEGDYSGVPVWSNDGRQIAYASAVSGKGLEVHIASADGTNSRKVFSSAAAVVVPTSFSSDDRLLAMMEVNPKTNMDILVTSLSDQKTTTFLNSVSVEILGRFSPDDRWMLYQVVDNIGASEVFVRAYPDGSGLRQVSNKGGALPSWTKGGREIVYTAGDAMMAVDVTPDGKALALGRPQKLFDLSLANPANARGYDVTKDGNRFAVLLAPDQKSAAPPRSNLIITFNLIREIQRVTK